jgi:uncharacterized protein (TIGR02466 family)
MIVPVVNKDIHLYFPTCVMQRRVDGAEALNAALAPYCRAQVQASAGVRKSNYGGWQSEPTLFASADPAVAMLRETVLRALTDISATIFGVPPQAMRVGDELVGWINVNEAGDYNTMHVHLPSTWSGVYYVETGAAPEAARPHSGQLELLDPRGPGIDGPGATLGHQSRIVIAPEPGLLVIFPGYLTHFVHPYAGATPRISIAFNTRVQRRG